MKAPALPLDRTIARKVAWRLVLPCMVLTLLSALDRVNISFAAAAMIADIKLSRAAYAAGISSFFAGYLLFQAPLMLLLGRIEARWWIGGCVLVWAGVATAMGFVHSAAAFLALRFLLGVGEAAFAPGMVFYLKRWVAPHARAGAFAWPMLSIPLSIVIGGPLSGWLLAHGPTLGMANWRWMFLAEAAPALGLAIVSFAWFDDRPDRAAWMHADEKARLAQLLAQEVDGPVGAARHASAFADPRLWASGCAWFAFLSGSYGLTYWLPLALHEMTRMGDRAIGSTAALPWIGVALGMALGAWHSDRSGERIWHVAAPAMLAGALLAAAGLFSGASAFAALILAGMMLGAAQGVFWTAPVGEMGASLGAGGIAAINMLGTLGGLVMPPAIGWLRGISGSFTAPVFALSVMLALGGGLIALMPHLGRHG